MKFRNKKFEIKLTNGFLARLMLAGLNPFNMYPNANNKVAFCQAWAMYFDVEFTPPPKDSDPKEVEKILMKFCEGFNSRALAMLSFKTDEAIERDIYASEEKSKNAKRRG